jgi:hypothetical protein
MRENPGGGREQATKTVVLFGRSVAVSSIGASLQGCAGLRVQAVEPEAPAAAAVRGAVQRLSALRPDVVLFDLASAPFDFAIALWRARPGALLIGMDLLAGQALVLSGRRTRAHTTEDLLQLIRRHDPGGEGDTERGRHGDAGMRGRGEEVMQRRDTKSEWDEGEVK